MIRNAILTAAAVLLLPFAQAEAKPGVPVKPTPPAIPGNVVGDPPAEDMPPTPPSDYVAWMKETKPTAIASAIRAHCSGVPHAHYNTWCGSYGLKSASKWQLEPVMTSAPARVAAFLSERAELFAVLDAFAKLVHQDPHFVTAPQAQKDLGAAIIKAQQAKTDLDLAKAKLLGLAGKPLEAQKAIVAAKEKLSQAADADVDKAKATADEEEAAVARVKDEDDALAQSVAALRVNAGGLEAAASTLGAVTGIDVNAVMEKLMQGLAIALANRAEAEAVGFALEEIHQNLCGSTATASDEQKVARQVLSNTCTLAMNGAFDGSRGASGLASLDTLRRAVMEDLNRLPETLTKLAVTADDYKTALGTDVHKEAVGTAAAELVGDLRRGRNAVAALDGFSDNLSLLFSSPPSNDEEWAITLLSSASHLPAGVMRTGAMVHDATAGEIDERAKGAATLLLLLTDPRLAWVSTEVLASPPKGLTEAETQLRLFGELAPKVMTVGDGVISSYRDLTAAFDATQKTAHSADGLSAQLEAALGAAADGLASSDEKARAEAAKKLRETVTSLKTVEKSARDAAILAERAFGSLEATSRSLETVVALGRQGANKAKIGTALKRARETFREARHLSAIVVASLSGDFATVWQELLRHLPPAGGGTCAAGVACFAASQSLVKHGGLLVGIATAKTPDEVSKVLLAAAAPVGSWRANYDSKATPVVAFGGLLGARFDPSYSVDRSHVKYQGDVFGEKVELGSGTPKLGLPVGVDVTLTPIAGDYLNLGVFAQLLDLGGYLNYGDGVHKTPRWTQGLSPGAWIRLGLFKSPFVLGAGAAYDIDAGGPTPKDGAAPGGMRWSVIVAVDTPLFILSRQ